MGDWTATIFVDNETKGFTQCRASKVIDAKSTLILAYNRDNHWLLALASSEPFKTRVGADQTVSLRFDQTTNWNVAARTTASNIIQTTIQAPELIEAFKRYHELAVETADGHRGTISLDGRIIGELAQCAQTQMAAEKGTQGTQPSQFAGNTPSQSQQPTAPGTQQVIGGSPQLELAATRIATSLLLQAKLPNGHLLSEGETPVFLRGLGAAWASDAGMGSVAVLPPASGHNANDVALNMITGGARVCKGEFAAGRSTSLVDDTLVTKAFTACSDSVGTRTVNFFILHREGSWYVVHAVTPPKGGNQTADSPLRDAAFQAAAVKATIYQ